MWEVPVSGMKVPFPRPAPFGDLPLALLYQHVQALAFSPDGSLLASLACPRDGHCSLALWLVEESTAAELVAGVELQEGVAGLAWEVPAPGRLPTFYTAGSQGLTQWQLESECLARTTVHMPAPLRGVAFTALATSCGPAGEGEEQLGSGSSGSAAAAGSGGAAGASLTMVYAGDACGRVWQLEVDSGQDVRQARLLAEVPAQGISCLCAPGVKHRGAPALLAVGTAAGSLLLLARDAAAESEAGWSVLAGEQLDGAVSHLTVDEACVRVTAATTSGTLWSLSPGSSPLQVLLCGQQQLQHFCSWQLAPGADWKRMPPAAALASTSGVAVWQLVRPARTFLSTCRLHCPDSSVNTGCGMQGPVPTCLECCSWPPLPAGA